MLKLFIVILYVIIIESEDEKNFKIMFVPKRRTLSFQPTVIQKAKSSKMAQESFFPVNRSGLHDSEGQSKEFNQKEDRNSHYYDLLIELSKRTSLTKMSSRSPRKENLIQMNKNMHIKSQDSEGLQNNFISKLRDSQSIDKSRLVQSISITESFVTPDSNRRVIPQGTIESRVKYSEHARATTPNHANVANEIPLNVLEIIDKKGIDEEEGINNYDGFDISNYKSDVGLRADGHNKEKCLSNSSKEIKYNTTVTKHATPVILLDDEQDDSSVSLIFSLINLKTLIPKTRLPLTQTQLTKKVMTHVPYKCLTKACTKKPILENSFHTPQGNTKTSTSKRKSKIDKTVCLAVNSSFTPRKVYGSSTPLFTIEPWPRLTVTKNMCFSSKPFSKIKMAQNFVNPTVASSSTQQLSQQLPHTTEKSTITGTHTGNFIDTVPLSNVLSSLGISDPKVYITTGGNSLFITNEVNITPVVKIGLPADNESPFSSAVNGIGPSTTQESSVYRTAKTNEQITLPVTSSTLLNNLLRININSSGYTPGRGSTACSDNSTTSLDQIIRTETPKIFDIFSTRIFSDILNSNDGLSNRVLSSSPLIELLYPNRSATEPTQSLNVHTSNTLSQNKNNDVTKPSDLHQNLNDSGFGTLVAETSNSLYPICPERQDYSISDERSTISKEKVAPDDSQLMSFSPPPLEAFSHEPESIETLFDDRKSGHGIGKCAGLLNRVESFTLQPAQQPSHFEKLLSSQTAIFTPTNKPVQSKDTSSKSSFFTRPSEQGQSIILGDLMKYSTDNKNSVTFSQGAFKQYISESRDNGNECLAGFSRLFSYLATKKCV